MQLSRCVTDYHVICKSCCKCNFVWRCEKRYTIWFVVVVIKGKKMESKYVCVVLYLVIYGNVRRIKLKIRKFKVTTILILVAFGWITLEEYWIYRWAWFEKVNNNDHITNLSFVFLIFFYTVSYVHRNY